ncbi:AIR synthase-related protein [Spirochaetota bacterium]
MKNEINRIEVFYRDIDPRGEVIKDKFRDMGYNISSVYISDNYLINAQLSREDVSAIARALSQMVTQDYIVNEPHMPEDFDFAIEIGFLPGVTDNVSHTVRETIEDLLTTKLDHDTSVFSTITYFFRGLAEFEEAKQISGELYNPLIQRMKILSKNDYIKDGGMGKVLPIVRISETPEALTVDLNIPGNELLKIGKEGIPDSDGARRGPLALDMISLNTIKDYFYNIEKRDPTDIELESIAQTWSEHCKHTIFAAEMDEVKDGIFDAYIKEATVRIRREKGEKDFCLSVFKDNAGGIEFDDDFIVSDKVETHNSPSALDPFGGAITGIVGVNRDSIGFGMASKPIANRYGFCFADPFDQKPLYKDRDEGSQLLSPRRILEGVVHGVNVGGNHSGIPTPQGFVYFNERYKGKPLVFVGTVGLIPKTVNGISAVYKKAQDGDCIVMIGGRVGRDGIHGATFSSEALNSGSPATAVQIGDPITQKKMSDAVVKEARDLGLYSSITDNGAGGLSCSVAEMARECGGFEVDLEKVPLKYPGLSPWQIWVSESQERMTFSIPPEKIEEFNGLMQKRGVESTVIGKFNSGNRGVVKFKGEKIFDLDMNFLHDGLPKKVLKTTYTRKPEKAPSFDEPENMTEVFYDMASRLNTASFEFISSQYDHEVQGNSVIKPLQGRGKVNGNATVIRPLPDSHKGVVMSQGLYPSYSDIDTYWMAACSIDTAVRNAISVGGSLKVMALLDNFCWCDSTNPERLGQLKEAARSCYDFAVSYGTPFVSGKDSMFNDFKGYDEDFNEVMISVPPTLLISSIGVLEDINICQSIDFKCPGDLIYVIGTTGDEMGGSEYLSYMGESISGKGYMGINVPRVNSEEFKKTYVAFEKALEKRLITSTISIERGGLGIALMKSSLAGLLGLSADLSQMPLNGIERNDGALFSESQGRFLVSVEPAKKKKFEKLFSKIPMGLIGTVSGDKKISIKGMGGKNIIDADIDELMKKYKGIFKGF